MNQLQMIWQEALRSLAHFMREFEFRDVDALLCRKLDAKPLASELKRAHTVPFHAATAERANFRKSAQIHVSRAQPNTIAIRCLSSSRFNNFQAARSFPTAMQTSQSDLFLLRDGHALRKGSVNLDT